MIKPTIIDYIGKYESGILVNIGLVIDENYYVGVFYYTDKHMWITVGDDYLNKRGFIQEDEQYYDLLEQLINMVEPHSKLYETLQDYEYIGHSS
jgi:hypothetical protein